jgi:flagellar biosynthetic protein FliQ
MTQEFVLSLAEKALWTMLLVSAPALILSLVAGVLVSIFQAVTQIHETTLAFIPKVVMVIVAIIIFFPWMMSTVITFTEEIFGLIAGIKQ